MTDQQPIYDYIYRLHLSRTPDVWYYIGRAEHHESRWKQHHRQIKDPYHQMYHDLARLEKEHDDEFVMTIHREVHEKQHSYEYTDIKEALEDGQPLLNKKDGEMAYCTTAWHAEVASNRKARSAKKKPKVPRKSKYDVSNADKVITPQLRAILIETAKWNYDDAGGMTAQLWGLTFTKSGWTDITFLTVTGHDFEQHFEGADDDEYYLNAGHFISTIDLTKYKL